MSLSLPGLIYLRVLTHSTFSSQSGRVGVSDAFEQFFTHTFSGQNQGEL
ncbi:MAG: hypothetical protein R3F50_21395 [Gammaproteobacteria bacterium]